MLIPFVLQAALPGGHVCKLGQALPERQLFILTMIAVLFTWGSMFALFPAIIGDYYGAQCATSNYGFLYTAKGVASIGGGGIAAALFVKYGNWNVPVLHDRSSDPGFCLC